MLGLTSRVIVILSLALLVFPSTLSAEEPGISTSEGMADTVVDSGPTGELEPEKGTGHLYLTSIDGGIDLFAVYDPATDTWTELTPYDTSAQMAVSIAGELYAYRNSPPQIDVYDAANDSWSYYMEAPTGTGGAKGNLKITSAGEFLYAEFQNPSLYYTEGGVWYSLPLPFPANAMADYDPTRNQYVVGEATTVNAHLIDLNTWAITDFSMSTGYNGEYGRFASVMNNRYYQCSHSDPIYSYDLADASLLAKDHKVLPGYYVSGAADRANGLIYIASLDGTHLWAFDAGTDTLNMLAGNGFDLWHSSLAFVPEVGGPAGTMHIGAIDGFFSVDFMGRAVLRMFLLTEDASGLPLPGAQVDVTIWVPGADPIERSRFTRPNGWARFHWGSRVSGTWRICVDQVILSGYVYIPDENAVTCQEWYN